MDTAEEGVTPKTVRGRHRKVLINRPGLATLKIVRLAKIGGTRLLGMGIGALASTIGVWAIVNNHGTTDYALFSLLTAVLMMLPFADLGLGISVVNLTTDFESGIISRDRYFEVYRYIRWLLRIAGVSLATASLILLLTGRWGAILGSIATSTSAQVSVTIIVVLVAANIPFGLGARILQGQGNMNAVVSFALIAPVVQLFFILPAALLLPEAAYVAIVPAVGASAVAFLTDRYARRVMELPTVRWSSLIKRPSRLSDVWISASSFLLISVGLVVAFQFQRILISHLSSSDELARYSLVAQYLVPVLSVATVAGQAMWSEYRRNVAVTTPRRLALHAVSFGFVGSLFALILVGVLTAISGELLSGEISLTAPILIFAAVYLILMFFHQPAAMYLNDSKGLRVQALLVTVMAATSVLLTAILVPNYGSAGAFLAIALAVGCVQTAPTFLYACRTIRRNAKRANLQRIDFEVASK